MIFNSFEFALFLPLVFLLYWWLGKNRKTTQNSLLLVASYVFYGWWDWRFLSLIFASSLLDFYIGQRIEGSQSEGQRKKFLALSLSVNLGFLAFFKYFNFFAESFADAFTLFGGSFEVDRLAIILPVGISFYTFQTLSYSIDIYRKKMTASKDLLSFLSFVSFFPQLVAGPIERANQLLPQFYNKRSFDYNEAVDGLKQMLWGLFKKMVIADNCAMLANDIFNNSSEHSGSTLVLGAVLFTFQIYGDFSGYSDIAIGCARLFGFRLMQNFAFPYFSRDIAEFWRRWHISLSTWFRDYLYIPLGGSRGGLVSKVRNTFIIFIVSGFWHGANWTFIVWGFLNACYFMPLLLAKKNRTNTDQIAQNSIFPSVKEVFQMMATFALTVLAWIFFRADNLPHAFQILGDIFSSSLFDMPFFGRKNPFIILLILLLGFVLIEWWGRKGKYALEYVLMQNHRSMRWGFYFILILAIITQAGGQQEFIYFQF